MFCVGGNGLNHATVEVHRRLCSWLRFSQMDLGSYIC